MLSKDIDNLLSLLALMIFADKRVHKDEEKAFVLLTDKLQAAREIEPRLSEAKILMWYEMNKARLKAVMDAPNFETWLYERLDALKPMPNKLPVLSVLCDIASADREVHVSEKALITLAAQRWDIAI